MSRETKPRTPSPNLERLLAHKAIADGWEQSLLGATGGDQLEFDPHPGQAAALAEIRSGLERGTRRFVLRAPRRWGKDRLFTDIALTMAKELGDKKRAAFLAPRVVVWFIDPTYRMAEQIWEERKRAIPASWTARPPHESKHQIWLKGDVFVDMRTADNPETLVAADIDILVVSDADRMQLGRVMASVRPALQNKERLRLVLINGTPFAGGEFKRLCKLGDDPHMEGIQSLFYPQWKVFEREGRLEVEPHEMGNPHVDPGEVQQVVNEEGLSRWVLQEYFAEFPSEQDAIFPNPAQHASAPPEKPKHPIVVGWDPAKWQDYSVAMAMDADGRSLAMERARTVDYVDQVGRVLGLAQRVEAKAIVVESNGPGEPLYDMLVHRVDEAQAHIRVEAFATTATTKPQIIEGLRLAYANGEVSLYPDPVVLNEFETFEPHRLASGRLRYGHPEGGHDDCVMATAFAYYGITQVAGVRAARASQLLGDAFDDAGGDGGDGPQRQKWHGGLGAAARGMSLTQERRWK